MAQSYINIKYKTIILEYTGIVYNIDTISSKFNLVFVDCAHFSDFKIDEILFVEMKEMVPN